MDELLFKKEIAFGLTPFETIYFDENGPQFMREHYNRLKRAHKILGLRINVDFNSFSSSINEYINGLNENQGIIKAIWFDEKFHMNFRKSNYTEEQYNRGFRIVTSKITRDSRNILNYLKTFNYGQNYIEDTRAKNKGFDTALFLNEKGYVCETAYANIFFVKEGKVFTPHVSCGILRGVMRDKIITVLRNRGIEVIKGFIRHSDLNGFEECFITNSVIGIMPVSHIDGIVFEIRDIINRLNR
jgi:branched-subunit amino acid aminotransferase/4-amino-4-deoxychorismate lyase